MTHQHHSHAHNTPFIIAVEGLDKSGKHTASQKIHDALNQAGLPTYTDSFPQYEHDFGALLYRYLHGELSLDAPTVELLYAIDKQAYQSVLRERHTKDLYDVALLDRYMHSGLCYGEYMNRHAHHMSAITPATPDSTSEWLTTIHSQLTPPTIVLYMDVNPRASRDRTGKHTCTHEFQAGSTNDRYESDLERLAFARFMYARDLGIPLPEQALTQELALSATDTLSDFGTWLDYEQDRLDAFFARKPIWFPDEIRTSTQRIPCDVYAIDATRPLEEVDELLDHVIPHMIRRVYQHKHARNLQRDA